MRVLVTSVAGRTGRLAAERLLAEPGFDTVIGLDARPCHPPVPGLRFVRADLRQPEWAPLLHEVDAVLMLAGLTGWPARRNLASWIIDGGKYALDAIKAAGVRKVIIATSATVYGPQPPGPVSEDAPIRGHRGGQYAWAQAMLSDYLDVLLRDWPGSVITRLRVAWTCGPHHPALPQYLLGGPVLACRHEHRLLQVIHEDDLMSAIVLALRDDLPGPYNIAADEGITFHELASLAGHNKACVPLGWLLARSWWRWRVLGTRLSPEWMRALYRGQVLETSRLRARGWTPRHSTRDTLVEALAIFEASGM